MIKVGAVIALFIILFIVILMIAGGIAGNKQSTTGSSKAYPYRPGVEFRLSDGRITTRGYAAAHPAEFPHWAYGPEGVYGENIDRTDWENWRVNYYGM